MKKLSRVTALILAAITAFIMPFSAFAFTSKSIFTTSTYTHQDRFAVYPITEGIDVSTHNGTIDWAKVKAAGVDFAIVRVGCRGYASSGKLLKDDMFETNLNGAYNAGLKVGVYFYSQAITKAEARAEAKYVLKYINAYKSKITMPVYFDYEFAPVSSGRLNKAWKNGDVNKSKLTLYTRAFCNKIKNAGFEAGVYASKAFFEDNLNYTELDTKYDIWLAHYATKTAYKGTFSLWQFTSTGTVNGIKGYVDGNFMYNLKTFDDYAIPRQAYTGEEIYPSFDVKYKGTVLRFGVDYYVTPKNNVNYGTAVVRVTGVNSYADFIPKEYSFDIVPTAVTGVEMTKRESTAITLKWNAHPEAESYAVLYRDMNGWHKSGETKETSYRVTGLTGATSYGFAVEAIKTVSGDKYFGIDSEAVNAFTKPTKVKGVKTSKRTKDSITLKWTKQTGATRYVIYKYNDETKAFEELGDSAKNSFTVSGLKANTQYRFKVKAACNTENGEEVFGALSSVYKDYTAPKTPKLKNAVSKKPYTIKASYKKVSGATGYQVMWSTTSTFTSNKKSVKVKTTTATVTTARSGGSYYVRVRAYVKRGSKYYYSAWSNSKHVYTK